MGQVLRDWFGLSTFRAEPGEPAAGALLYLLEEVGSTSDFFMGRGPAAFGRLCEGDGWGWRAGPPQAWEPISQPTAQTYVVAKRQTAGHGRQGRVWVDCGGLQLSFAMTPAEGVIRAGFSVWVGLMVVLVMRECFQVDARLKWPNDIFVGGRKLGGVLLQRGGAMNQSTVVIGVGLNLSTTVSELPVVLQGRATSCFIETGDCPRPGLVAGELLQRLHRELARFSAHGWSEYREVRDRMDCLLGQEVQLEVAGDVVRGRSRGIDAAGALLIEDRVGRLGAHHAGEAHVVTGGSPATEG